MATSPSERQFARTVNRFIGFGCVVAGAIGLVILFIVQTEGKFLGWEDWVRQMPVFWGVASVAIAAFGVRYSWMIEHARTSWLPTIDGQRFDTVILYTRPGCHLCEEAHDLLSQYCAWLPRVVEVNIDEHPDLQDQFDTCVPVVECDGKIRFRGRVPEPLLQRLIEGTEPL
ncbi:MAG: glutaredoxin family protein [Planctomycetaceae bacterium]